MRVLIAISSCELFERNGCNDACRETWLKDIPEGSSLEYRFFVGSRIQTNASEAEGCADVCGNLSSARLAEVPDIELIDCFDDYGHLTSKTQVSLRWAAERNYDFVFRCFPDTYVRPERLLSCRFELFDYYGDFRGEFLGKQNYASGGAGYFLSSTAYKHLLDAPITGVWRDDITPYAEDLWVGNRLGVDWPSKKLRYFDDTNRFLNKGQSYWPNKNNKVVTSHLSCGTPNEKYRKEMMYAAHNSWRQSNDAV
jgi:hypothetical protein